VSVHKEGDVWVVRKRIDGHQRKFRPSTSGYPNTKRGAEKFEAGLITEIEKGTYCHPDGSTVAEYAERWYTIRVCRKTTPKTQQYVRSILDAHIIPGLGARHLSKVKPVDIEEFYAGLKRADGKPGELSASSRSAIHRVLNAMLNHAVEMEAIPRNPIKRGLAPKPGPAKTTCYDIDQAKQLLALSRGTLHVVIALAIHTGMRIGEICALRWTDVDLEARTITVQRSMEQTTKGIREKGTKTGKGRTIDIGEYLTNVLTLHKGDQAQRRLQGSLREYVGHVVTYENGAPNAPYNMTAKWMRFVKEETDLPYLNFHTLRHTHVSLLIAQGEGAKEISVRVGHSNISMTMDTYGHLMKGSGAQLAKRLDAALGT
jgi:integrase